jgi:signal transduction histidine kinase
MGWGWMPVPADGAVLIALYSAAVQTRVVMSVAALAVVAGIAGGWTWYVENTLVVKDLPIVEKQKAASSKATVFPAVSAWAFPPASLFPPVTWGGFTVQGLVILPAWVAGQISRARRTYLERDQARQAELAVAAERARMSRELHDVVAHGLSVMVVQAQGATAALDADRERTREALSAIVTTGRQSLAEMRRLLGILREPAGDDVLLAPQPGVAQLPGLVTRLRDTGLRVDFEVVGTARPLPAAVDMSAYRIVQEALTNVIKHAGDDRHALTRLSFEDGVVVVEVCDDGTGGAVPDGKGNGLRGMRERVAMLGGELIAGPGSRGGFQVQAWLPAGQAS